MYVNNNENLKYFHQFDQWPLDAVGCRIVRWKKKKEKGRLVTLEDLDDFER